MATKKTNPWIQEYTRMRLYSEVSSRLRTQTDNPGQSTDKKRIDWTQRAGVATPLRERGSRGLYNYRRANKISQNPLLLRKNILKTTNRYHYYFFYPGINAPDVLVPFYSRCKLIRSEISFIL